jgi:hypothetical protein
VTMMGSRELHAITAECTINHAGKPEWDVIPEDDDYIAWDLFEHCKGDLRDRVSCASCLSNLCEEPRQGNGNPKGYFIIRENWPVHDLPCPRHPRISRAWKLSDKSL